jgi:hypothetical protein
MMSKHVGACAAMSLLLAAAPALGQNSTTVTTSPWAGYVAAAQSEAVSRLKGFSVVLVEGDIRAGAPNDSVPAAAAKALSDLKDFLPYRSYRLIDTQWTLGSNRVSSRLRGPDGQEYDLTLTTGSAAFLVAPAVRSNPPSAPAGSKDTVVIANFVLRDAAAVPDRTAALVSRGLLAPNDPDVRARVLASKNASLIDTSFRMDIGETVVVGTSRLQGEKALIVLLTAVGK